MNIGVPWRRDNEYVRNFNKLLKEDIDKLNLNNVKYIESFKGLNFENASIEEIEQSELTYDGEHLKYEGYVDWFKYIDKKIDGGIYQN